MTIEITELPTALGPIFIASGPDGLCALEFTEHWPVARAKLEQRFKFRTPVQSGDPFSAAERLTAYFAGRLDALDGLPVDPGGTAFQHRVWLALRAIPAGTTWSYERLADEVGSGPRAVGAANGQNPIALVLPCHRVIGKDGTLRGYGGGLPRKAWLLRHEGVPIDFARAA